MLNNFKWYNIYFIFYHLEILKNTFYNKKKKKKKDALMNLIYCVVKVCMMTFIHSNVFCYLIYYFILYTNKLSFNNNYNIYLFIYYLIIYYLIYLLFI